MWALITMFGIVAMIAVVAVVSVSLFKTYRRKAEVAGHASILDYLRAVPQSDQDRQDAVDLALKGGIACLLGLVFPPLILIGAAPLFYGLRKLLYARMGLGLVTDDSQTGE